MMTTLMLLLLLVSVEPFLAPVQISRQQKLCMVANKGVVLSNSTFGGLVPFQQMASDRLNSALMVVSTRSARDRALTSQAVELAQKKAKQSAEDLKETRILVQKSNLTFFETLTLAWGAGLGPTRILGAPKLRQDAILNAVSAKLSPRRDVVAAATAVADAAYLSKKALPPIYFKPVLPRASLPPSRSEKKKERGTEEEVNVFGLVIVTANVASRLLQTVAAILGPDLGKLVHRATDRLKRAAADPVYPGPVRLLDGLQLSPQAAFINNGGGPPLGARRREF